MEHVRAVVENFIEELNEETTLEENVEKELSLQISSYLEQFKFVLEYCQTPIEQLFAINFLPLFMRSPLQKFFEVSDFNAQTSVEVGDKCYRVDFQIILADPNRKNMSFVIECDGHDFHERTKEQARKDKERQRALQMEGYTVIRFTGSEIVTNAKKCAEEALYIIEKFAVDYSK